MRAILYDASFARKDSVIRANHGKTWTQAHCDQLAEGFIRGLPLSQICEQLGRAGDVVLAKMVQVLMLVRVPLGNYRYEYYVTNEWFIKIKLDNPYLLAARPTPVPQLQPEIETDMNDTKSPIIVTQYLIAGQNADSMDDGAIFKLIAKLELEAEQLGKISNKPKKLVARIQAIKEDVQKLVDFVDARP